MMHFCWEMFLIEKINYKKDEKERGKGKTAKKYNAQIRKSWNEDEESLKKMSPYTKIHQDRAETRS